MMKRAVGIKQVAEAAGVSVTTVSHALNEKGRLPPETRDHVRRIAAQLGYRPNATARSLAGGRTGLVGLAVAQSVDGRFAVSDFAYYSQLMSAATSAAIDHGYALVLASGSEAGAWTHIRLDGVIVVDPVRSDPLSHEFRAQGLPIVTTGRVPDGGPGHWVDNDHRAGTDAILDHLAARGAQRIALLGSPLVTSYAIDVRNAYQQWCARHGQEAVVVEARDDLTEGSGFEATRRLLSRRRPPDAIYATLDRLALGALLAAEARGLSVPRELLVAGCTDSEAGKWARPSLTALALNPEEIGRAALTMVTRMIEGTDLDPANVLIPTRVLPRGSTRRRVHRSAGRPGKASARADVA